MTYLENREKVNIYDYCIDWYIQVYGSNYRSKYKVLIIYFIYILTSYKLSASIKQKLKLSKKLGIKIVGIKNGSNAYETFNKRKIWLKSNC